MEDDTLSSNESNSQDMSQAVDVIWVFFCLVLVVLMQAGFASYEVGLSSVAST
ncbi:unnamed protein product, partial [Hapterophycus canaliculatus]